MTQSLVSRPQPNSVERRHGLHDNFNTLHALSVKGWLHARRVMACLQRFYVLGSTGELGSLRDTPDSWPGASRCFLSVE